MKDGSGARRFSCYAPDSCHPWYEQETWCTDCDVSLDLLVVVNLNTVTVERRARLEVQQRPGHSLECAIRHLLILPIGYLTSRPPRLPGHARD
jgi:hypothetical protein